MWRFEIFMKNMEKESRPLELPPGGGVGKGAPRAPHPPNKFLGSPTSTWQAWGTITLRVGGDNVGGWMSHSGGA